MPELPDVEGFRRVVVDHAQGRRVRRVHVVDAGVLRDVSPSELADAVTGHRINTPQRHGKWLFIRTDGPTIMLHFGMTGQLRWCAADEPRHRHDRVVFAVDGGELRYRDMRKLQGLRVAPDWESVERVVARLGPDARAIRRKEFDTRLARSRATVKAVLIDQGVLAGLGNLLADEIAWRAGVHPCHAADRLPPSRRRALYDQMRTVLRLSVAAGHVPSRHSWLTGVRDKPHPTCPRCGTALSRGRVGGRTTVWCPQCQLPPS